MEKAYINSKTIQGIVLAAAGFLWGLWVGESSISQTVVIAGLGYAGIGYRAAQK